MLNPFNDMGGKTRLEFYLVTGCTHYSFHLTITGLTQIQHAARDLFIFNPLNPPYQGDL